MLQILCLLLVWSLAPSPLHADAPAHVESDSPEYQKLVNDAIQEYRAKNFPEARSLFARANTLFPNARTMRGLGMAEFELRNYGDCIDLLRRALDSKVRPLDGELRGETEALLARAESFVARLNIEANPMPSTVIVDGTPVQLRDGTSLVLTVGDHLLEFRAPGYSPEKRVLKVKGGEQGTLHIALPRHDAVTLPESAARAEPTQFPASPERQDADPRRPLYKNPWLWTGVGVVVAGAALGLGLGLRKSGGTADPIATDPIAIRKGP